MEQRPGFECCWFVVFFGCLSDACFLFKLLVSGSLSTALVHMVSKEAPAGVPAAVKITQRGCETKSSFIPASPA